MSWFLLLLGGIFEVAFTTCLRYVQGFKNIPWTAGFLVSTFLSLTFLEMAARTIPLGTAYAIWTGIGALGTVLIGMMWFGEPHTAMRLILIAGIVGCVIGLKMTSGH
ncbi:MAG: DMT family transporter [Janthinobacterium lividum]